MIANVSADGSPLSTATTVKVHVPPHRPLKVAVFPSGSTVIDVIEVLTIMVPLAESE